MASCLGQRKVTGKNTVSTGDKYEDDRHAARRIRFEHHLLNHQSGLPAMRWKHDGIPMLRQMPPELARRVGVGKQHNEELGRRQCRNRKTVQPCVVSDCQTFGK